MIEAHSAETQPARGSQARCHDEMAERFLMQGFEISIDHHVLSAITIMGLLLGVVGSLYLTYDLLGRAQLVLRWFVRLMTPTLIGALILGGAGAIIYIQVYPTLDPGFGALLYATVGGIIGLFNGLFVNPRVERPTLFSLRHSLVGLLVTPLLVFTGEFPVVLAVNRPAELALRAALAAGIVGAVAAGVWRFINHASARREHLPFLSARGAIIGFGAAAVFGFAIFFFINATFGVAIDVSARGALRAVFFIAPAGALIGSISRYVFWWADALPGYRLGAIGVMLTLIGFTVQLIEPLIRLFDLPVR